MGNLKKFQDEIARMATGMTRDEALKQGICIECKKPPTFSTEAGEREYTISGMCEPCFDTLFAEEE